MSCWTIQTEFRAGFPVPHEKPEEGQRTHRWKRSRYNNKDEDNSPNTLKDKKVHHCYEDISYHTPKMDSSNLNIFSELARSGKTTSCFLRDI